MDTRMNIDKLKELLNDFAWEEQMEFELSERGHDESNEMREEIKNKIQNLAQRLTPMILDSLEEDKSYLTWVLRLSPHVPNDHPKKRAYRHLKNMDRNVRYWAKQITSREY